MFSQRVSTLRALCGNSVEITGDSSSAQPLIMIYLSLISPLFSLLTVQQQPERCSFWQVSLVEFSISHPAPLKP